MSAEKTKTIKGSGKHGSKECDCPFCLCKCPVCGTQGIGIVFKPRWEINNTAADRISISRIEDSIVVECPECDILEYDKCNAETGANLTKLIKCFNQALDLPDDADLKIKDDGTIDISR